MRWRSEKLSITVASMQSIWLWMHRFSKLYNLFEKFRRLLALVGIVVNINGYRCFPWALKRLGMV